MLQFVAGDGNIWVPTTTMKQCAELSVTDERSSKCLLNECQCLVHTSTKTSKNSKSYMLNQVEN